MDLLSIIVGVVAKGAYDIVRSSMERNKKAQPVATLFEIEIEDIKKHYADFTFHPSEPLGIVPPDVMTYSEHGAWRLFELFPGKVARAITTFYRSVSEVHKPIAVAQRAIHELGFEAWKGLRSSSSHRRLVTRFDDSKRQLLVRADDALREIRAWRSSLPIDAGQEDQ